MRSLVGVALLAMVDCASPNLFVSDEDGHPVEGATVTGSWPSTTSQVATTDRDGAARVEVTQGSSLRPEMMSITVEKPGYQRVYVNAQAPQPIHVVLRRTTK